MAVQDARTHYAVCLRWSNEERFIVWYSDEKDGVLLLTPSTLALFASRPDVERYASAHDIDLDPQASTLYDLDRLTEWLSAPTLTPDCSFLLDAWNMLADIAGSLQTALAEPAEAQAIYDKLFWGCNLPSVTPPGKHYDPIWSQEEITTVVAVLRSGLRLLRDAFGHPVDTASH